MRAIVTPEAGSYSYAGTSYANPHAVTQIANGLSTTTLSYDSNENVIQKKADAVTTNYVWAYANRLNALGSGGARFPLSCLLFVVANYRYSCRATAYI